MINAEPTTTTYLKQPVATGSTGSVGASTGGSEFRGGPARNSQEPKKIFGFELRSILTVLGLTGFFLAAMVGVAISIRQRIDRTATAPTAPQSRPSADVVRTATCSLTFTVAGSSPSPSLSTTPSPSPSTTPSPSPSTSPSPTPSSTPLYSCNQPCTTSSQCASSDQMCYNNRCRLIANVNSETCSTPGTSPSPTPSPAIGCNYSCNSNADCTNPAHICYTVSDGNNRCRLESNPTNESCVTPITTTTQTQPQLPNELPQTGPEDWGKWLGAGLATLGVGALLLLLL